MRVVAGCFLVLALTAQALAWSPLPEPSSPEVARRQEWVMAHCPMGAQWNMPLFQRHLGPAEKLSVTQRNPKIFEAYYFPQAEVTLLRNLKKNSVVTYGFGRNGDL